MSPAKAKRKTKASTSRADFKDARKIALSFPGTEEAPSYGTPGFRVRGKLFSRFHDGGEFLVVRANFDEREALLASDPKTFVVTDHYRDHPYVLVRMGSVSRAMLVEVLEQAWRERAPKRLVREFDADQSPE